MRDNGRNIVSAWPKRWWVALSAVLHFTRDVIRNSDNSNGSFYNYMLVLTFINLIFLVVIANFNKFSNNLTIQM